uniref:Reverse transcriptase domain-containing protein n=1 Tax=Cajanus cajan TaxID=3821 RepID=A0A151U9S9_CAJCA|nr:hypothetical protein KK1_020298 [Cajanus cajan]
MVNWKRKKSSIKGLYIDGSWVEVPKEVKKEVKQFFNKIYDPIAPLLFIVVVEDLIVMMRTTISENMFEGLIVGKNQVKVSILQYANDTILLGKEKLSNVVIIKSILICFELISGLKVNFAKSRFDGVGVERKTLVSYAFLLNCKLFKLNQSFVSSRKKLYLWKYKLSLMAGRIYLINLVLSSLFLFFMSFYKMPKLVVKQIVIKYTK